MTRPRSSYRSDDRGDFSRDRDRGDRDWGRGGSRGYGRGGSDDGGVGSFFETSLREHPLLLGLGAALAGAVVGTLIPNSRYEHGAMGEHRNRLLDEGMQRGRSVARDALSGAERAIDAAVEEFANEFEGSGSEDSEGGSDEESEAKASAAGASGDAQKRANASAAKSENSGKEEGDSKKKEGEGDDKKKGGA